MGWVVCNFIIEIGKNLEKSWSEKLPSGKMMDNCAGGSLLQIGQSDNTIDKKMSKNSWI